MTGTATINDEPAVPKEPIVRLQPYYQDDLVTIYNGDALEVLPRLPSKHFDVIATDPPYMLGSASTRRGTRAQSPVADWTNASRLYRDWIREMDRVAKETAPIWMFGNWRSLPVLEMAVQSLAKRITSILVWDKEWIGVGSMNGLRCQYESVFLLGGDDFAVKDRALPDIWREKWASARPNGHPQEKPLRLMERMIDVSGDGCVLDPFMGSGTTLIAARQAARRSVGIEISEEYCEMAVDRLRQGILF